MKKKLYVVWVKALPNDINPASSVPTLAQDLEVGHGQDGNATILQAHSHHLSIRADVS